VKTRILELLALAAVVAAAAAAAGCGSTSDTSLRDSLDALRTPAATVSSTTPTLNPLAGLVQQVDLTLSPLCVNTEASLRPTELPTPGRMPRGSFMRRIEQRGHLVAGVDQNTLLYGYLDPFTGRLQGLEIDLLRNLATAIFGNPNAIDFKVLTTADERLQDVEDGSVDVVADAVTINCERLQDVAFSTVYYDAQQRILVPSSAKARGVQDLGGKRVCARAGTTSLDNITKQPSHPIPFPVEQRTDCLVALQEGRVDAITSDDSILRGFQVQDPYTKLVGSSLEPEPYGMVIAKSHPDFVRFVNGVLARMRADGSLKALYHKWLGTSAPHVPRAQYRN